MTVTYNDATYTYDDARLTYDGTLPQFDNATVTVQAAFGSAPLDTSPRWQDITEWVRHLNINRGRRSEYVSYGVGRAVITLDNRDRRFDPEYTSSPYYGDLNPMVPIRVQATYGGATYTLFYGFAQGWPTVYAMPNVDAVTRLQVIDLSRILRQIETPVTLYGNYVKSVATANTFYWPLTQPTAGLAYDEINNVPVDVAEYSSVNPTAYESDAAAGDPVMMAARNGNSGVTLAGRAGDPKPFTTGKIKSVAFIVDATCENPDYAGVGADGAIVTFLTATNDGISVAYGSGFLDVYYSNVTDNQYATVNLTQGFTRDRANLVVVEAAAGYITTYVNGVSVNVTALSTGTQTIVALLKSYIRITAKGSIGQVVVSDTVLGNTNMFNNAFGYDGDDTGTRLNRIQQATINIPSLFDIETGDQTVSPYYTEGANLLDVAEQLAIIETGSAYVSKDNKLTFKNRSTMNGTNIVAIFDDENIDTQYSGISVDGHTLDTIVNRVTARYQYGTVTVEDTASIDAYGTAQRNLDARMTDNPTVATQTAQSLLDRSSQPKTRITQLDINVRSDTAQALPVVASLDLTDDVAVRFTPTGVGDPLWRAVTVQGISHTITSDSWETELYLAPGAINTNGALLVLNDDTYGKLDSGNKLG